MIHELAVAVVNKITEHLETTDHYVRLMPSGKPHATMNDWFVAVYPSLWSFPGNQSGQLQEEYGITCTVTKRINANPHTNLGASIYVKDSQAIIKIVRQIILAIHNNYSLLSYIDDNMREDYPVSTALHVSQVDPTPEVVDAFWFWTDDLDPSEFIKKNMYGLTMSVTFSGAMRVQPTTTIGFD